MSDGHADHDRDQRRAVRLSLARAETVRDQLVRYDLDPDQIVMAAYGGSRQRVVIWGTRAVMDAIVARTLRRGHAVIWNGVITEAAEPGSAYAGNVPIAVVVDGGYRNGITAPS